MKIDFKFHTQYGTYGDALIFLDNELIPSDDEIEALKQQRLNNWLTLLSATEEAA
jgi:hypothetical protein